MNRSPFQKAMYSIAFIYTGVFLFSLPFVFRFSSYITPLIYGIGMFFIFIGCFLLFYDKLSRKIDSISDNISNLKEAGIEEIIPVESNSYDYLEKLIFGSNNVKIAINAYRLTDKFCYFLNSLFENENIKYQLIVLGILNDSKTHFFIEDLEQKQKENVSIKFLKNYQIDNIIIFNQKSCIMHYNNYDNRLSFFIVFYAASENSHKNRQLFEDLWNKGEIFLSSGEEEQCL